MTEFSYDARCLNPQQSVPTIEWVGIPVIDEGEFWRGEAVCLRCTMDANLRVLFLQLITVKRREIFLDDNYCASASGAQKS